MIKLTNDQYTYRIEAFHNIEEYEDIAKILLCFLSENCLLLFACPDNNNFLEDLESEDDETKNFYKKIIEYNIKYYGEGILRMDEDEIKNISFINERTAFVNYESDFPIAQFNSSKKRRTIWYRTSTMEDIIKAIKINYLFKCVVIKKGETFENFRYGIGHYETEIGSDLLIIEKQQGRFLSQVYPKVQSIIKNIEDNKNIT